MWNLWDLKSLHQYGIALFRFFCLNLDQHLKDVEGSSVHVTFHVLSKEPKPWFSLVSIFFLMPHGFWSWVWQLDSILSSPQISLPGEMPAFVTHNTKLLPSSLYLWVSVLQKGSQELYQFYRGKWSPKWSHLLKVTLESASKTLILAQLGVKHLFHDTLS